MEKEWFASWFDSPYYHILYKQHDESEAHAFIDGLLAYFKPHAGATFLDVACGKGRHARYLADKGYDVTGIDLSPNSIKAAKEFENSHVHFAIHDMRCVYKPGAFDYVVNLFTSFGYLDTNHDNLMALEAMCQNLHPEGTCIIDYFNALKVCNDLQMRCDFVNEREGITFNIHKHVESHEIVKDIRFEDKGHPYAFTEKVWLYKLSDFEKMMAKAGLKIIQTFGDYALNPFDEQQSPRLILVAQKI